MRGANLRQHAAEVDLDFRKAFEHVDRRLLLEEAVALGCPPSALMAALDMYAMKRRLVFRGCVGPEMWALRGIGACRAFAC